MRLIHVLSFLCLVRGPDLTQGGCSPSLFKLDSNSLLTLSDDLLNVTEAENQCNSLGGNLVVVKDQMINETLYDSLTKYTEDLKRIRKYYNDNTNVYSYSTDALDSTEGWKIPEEDLKYIYLHESSTASDDQLIQFCEPAGGIRNIIKNDSCNGGNGWGNGALSGYGGKTTSSKHRKVYSVEGNYGGGWSARLTYEAQDAQDVFYIYEPVYYVYVGNVIETSSLTACQQNAWHYEEDWVLTKKDCGEEAYYACQVKDLLEPYWNQTSCKGSSIEVGWKDNLDGLKESGIDLEDVKVKVKVDDQWESEEYPLNSSPVPIDNLTPQTSHSITVTATLSGCTNLSIESTLLITTGDSPPDPVTDAFVWNPSECIVEIPLHSGSSSSGKPTSYQITAISEVNTTTEYFLMSSDEIIQTIKFNISINGHGFEQRINLTITSISGNCSAENRSVLGYCISPGCSPSLFKLDSNSLLTLSDDLLDATEAENQCNSLGGNLVVVKDQMINETLYDSLTKYTKDLKRIWKYFQTTDKIYSYSIGNLDGWDVPDEDLKYIYLHESPSASDDQLLHFCKPISSGMRTIIKNDSCPDSECWERSGLFGYGGKATSSKHRKVYSVEGDYGGGWSANLTYEAHYAKAVFYIYEPVYYVYIGAQFNSPSSKWTWSDGTDAGFNTSVSTGCQQKAFHYEKDWVLTNKDCTKKAYYACQVEDLLQIFWNETTCNSSIVQVGWKHNLDEVKNKITSLNHIMVTVKVDNRSESEPYPLDNSIVTIYDLTPLTSYNITVTAMLGGCTDLNIESTLIITTRDSSPDPITDAFVWSPYECIVEIPKQPINPRSGKATAYQITAVSEGKTTTQMFDVSSDETSQTLNISTNDHGFEQRVYLTITSLSGNCSATNQSVQGYCISPAACNIVVAGIQDSVLTLSDDLADVNTAEEKCCSFGGNLIKLTEQQVRETLDKIMTDRYARDLTRVWIFYNEGNSRFTKYSRNVNATSPWKSTEAQGTLEFTDLSNKIFPNAFKSVYFCHFNQERWAVQNDSCHEGWTTDFILYKGRNSSWLFKEVYNYRDSNNMNPTNSSRLLSDDEAFGNYTEKEESVYVADVNVFIGARYNVDTGMWLWSDGSEAYFDQPSSKTCQQKILHYGKSWELADVDCDHYQALFACQTRLTLSSSTNSCNSTFAQVESSDNLLKLTKQTNHEIQIKIEINENIVQTPTSAQYQEKRVTFSNLSPRTTYYATVTTIFEGCNNFNISSTLNFTTGYGPPDPVSNPQVKQSEDSCIVTVDQDDPSANIEQYVITANSTEVSRVLSFIASDNWNFTISTSEYGTAGEIIQLSVYSINCEGQSEPVQVEGVCSSPKAGGGVSVGAVVGGVIGGLMVLLIVVIIFLYKRRTTKKSYTDTGNPAREDFPLSSPYSDNQATQQPQVYCNPHASRDVLLSDRDPVYENLAPSISASLLAAYRSKSTNDGQIFKDEFQDIVRQSKANQPPHVVAQHSSNTQRNRYRNIYPYDHSRVVLNNNGESDYINAAFMSGFTDEHKFIASQGPKESTLDDFWLMTWQQRSNVIIMLTKLRENQRVKCDKYWPDLGKSKTYGTIRVTTTEENTMTGIVERKFELDQSMVKRTVTQFHYVTWPDHGIPVATSNMFYLRKMVEEIQEKGNPIIVHCSAGAGRTGTYIAMDFLFDQLDAERKYEVIRCVSNMKENRTDMVQNWKQYALIYKLIVEHKVFPCSDRTTEEIQALTEADASKIMTQEFNLLSTSVPTIGTQNNDLLIKIWDEDDQAVKTMNASRIDGLDEENDYISAQGPTPKTKGIFWIMALERQNGLIVCMEGNSDHVANAVEHETIQMGKISIRVESSQDHRFAIEKELSYSGASMLQGKRTFLAFRGWSSTALPSESCMLDFLMKIKQLSEEDSTGSILVYCSDGCSKSGTLIALMNVLERARTQNKVDVFRTVKDLRDARPNMVDNMSNYRFIYAVLMEYISSFNPYVNYR